ncbi:MAG: porin [Desulfobacterales bacterium]|nr:porin [Desulfobacterales bacterium]
MVKKIMAVLVLFLSGGGAAHSFDMNDISIHGFASTGYIVSSDNNFLLPSKDGSFEFNEVGINFTTSVAENIRVGLQFYSFDLGDIGNNNVKLDWAFLDYQWKDALGIRLGKIKTPEGLYTEVQDYDMLRTSILLPQSILYYKYFRETAISYQGADIYGNISLNKAGNLHYDMFVGTLNIDDEGGIAKYLLKESVNYKSSKADYIAGSRVKWNTPLKGLLLSATYTHIDLTYNLTSSAAPIDTKMEMPNMHNYYFSAEYNIGDLTAAAEYQRVKSDVTVTTDLSKLGIPNLEPTETESNNESWFALLSYRFTDWFEAGAYYSVYYADAKDRKGSALEPNYSGWQKDTTLSARFDITDFWLVKLEVHFMDGVALCLYADNPEGYGARNWTLFAIKTTFNF